MPLLAICRGMQNLNIARGGDLIQHLGDIEGKLPHRQETPSDQPSHAAKVEEGSLLARCLGATEVEVNSFHHQAVRKLGCGLKEVAWAPDGTIEGIEDADRPFCLGVQWHAELLVRTMAEQLRLFEAFVAACAEARSDDASVSPARRPGTVKA
ncbi:hypothetical protein BH10ACT11_BH10ACT11_12580 [soil metagenome]